MLQNWTEIKRKRKVAGEARRCFFNAHAPVGARTDGRESERERTHVRVSLYIRPGRMLGRNPRGGEGVSRTPLSIRGCGPRRHARRRHAHTGRIRKARAPETNNLFYVCAGGTLKLRYFTVSEWLLDAQLAGSESISCLPCSRRRGSGCLDYKGNSVVKYRQQMLALAICMCRLTLLAARCTLKAFGL